MGWLVRGLRRLVGTMQCAVRKTPTRRPQSEGTDRRTRVEAHRTAEADDAKKWRKYATMGPAEARKVLRSIQ